MKERPILFSAPMVQAILAGQKTQTRREVKHQFPADAQPEEMCAVTPEGWQCAGHSGRWWNAVDGDDTKAMQCPYGQPGDRLYVRETYFQFGHWEPVPGVKTKTGRMKWRFVPDSDTIHFPDTMPFSQIDHKIRKGRHHKDSATSAWHKRLARFMPRAYSRIKVEVTGVRVERLHDISREDAKAEGIEPADFPGTPSYKDYLNTGCADVDPRKSFGSLWASINGLDSWASDPWVWVVEFRRVTA